MKTAVQFRPISIWPGECTRQRTRSLFKSPYSRTLDDLDRELEHLRAEEVVIEIALRDTDIRLDGWPRSNARPSHPGVILSLQSKHGPLRYPGDRFDKWEDNLRAIALALEALRKVDRYGVTQRGEQYTGWAALPAPEQVGGFASPEQAARWIHNKTVELIGENLGHTPSSSTEGTILQSKDSYTRAWRQLANKLHPDKCAGDRSGWDQLQAARTLLDRHFSNGD